MAHPTTVKRKVRERDNQQCCGCGMTAEEHKRRFGRGLHGHRTEYMGAFSLGPYEVDKCQTLCTLCHQAKHNPRLGSYASIRKRDGWACTECGMYEEEHRKLHKCPLHVHCKLEGHCDRWGFRGQEAKAEQCSTLCLFCHLGKHSIHPAVLRRDKFQCVDCGKKPDDNRLWRGVVTVHRLSGDCDEEIGPDADPARFLTLCLDCHEKRHPERFAKCIELGGTVCLDKIMASELEIALPITSKDQLAPFKEYLLLVNKLIEDFRKNGIPGNDRQLYKVARAFPHNSLSRWPREQAAVEARGALITAHSFTTAPLPSLSRREKKAMNKMSEEQKKAFLREREERHLKRGEKYLEDVIRRNADPTIEIEMKNGRRCRVGI